MVINLSNWICSCKLVCPEPSYPPGDHPRPWRPVGCSTILPVGSEDCHRQRQGNGHQVSMTAGMKNPWHLTLSLPGSSPAMTVPSFTSWGEVSGQLTVMTLSRSLCNVYLWCCSWSLLQISLLSHRAEAHGLDLLPLLLSLWILPGLQQ